MHNCKQLKHLARDESGALAPLFLFILLFLVWAALGILNTGQDTREKITAQNGVDAVSLAVADQSARDLNIMAINHVAASQSYTIALSSAALTQALLQTMLRSGSATLDSIVRCRLKIFIKACAVVAVGNATFGVRAGFTYARYLPHKGITVGNRLTRALDRMNRHIVNTHPERAEKLTREVATANGLSAVFVFPRCDPSNGSQCGMSRDFPPTSLPVEAPSGVFSARGIAAQLEMCRGITSGSDGFARLDYSQRGFPVGRGPLTAGGSDRNPSLRDHINRTSGLSVLLPQFYNYMFVTQVIVNYTSLSLHRNRQTSNSNEFLDIFDANWSLGCLNPSQVGRAFSNPVVLAGAALNQVLVARPANYWLKGRNPLLSATAYLGGIGTLANSTMADFEPFKALHLAALPQGKRSNPEDFNFLNEPSYSYAQSLVYNSIAHDLYTGRWTSSLVPSTHFDDPQEIGQSIAREGAHPDFNELRDMLLAAGGNGQWAEVNAH